MVARTKRFGVTRSWCHHTDATFSKGNQSGNDWYGGLRLTRRKGDFDGRQTSGWIHHAYIYVPT